MTEASFDTIVTNIAQLVTADPARATGSDPLGIITDAALAIRAGRVAWLGAERDLDGARVTAETTRIDAHGAVVTPGLIDSHTHLVFGGSREAEFARRLEGVPYMRIAAEGGGIHASVRATREASEEWLVARGAHWLDEMRAQGVTTVEIKSGYGLSTEHELKQLRAIAKLAGETPTRIVPTFMGAHEIPLEFRERRNAYVALLNEEMLPAVAEQGVARFCDIFCEEGVFTREEARSHLLRARELGLDVRMHADEFVDTDGAALAAELGCASADHLMAVSADGIAALAKAQVVATLLPATTYTLGSTRYAPARALLDAGVPVALATDFNPGSACVSNLALVMNMACTQLRMRFSEVLLGATLHAARALRLERECGRLALDYAADFVLWDIPRPEYLVYHLGRNHVHAVYMKGLPVHTAARKPVFLSA